MSKIIHLICILWRHQALALLDCMTFTIFCFFTLFNFYFINDLIFFFRFFYICIFYIYMFHFFGFFSRTGGCICLCPFLCGSLLYSLYKINRKKILATEFYRFVPKITSRLIKLSDPLVILLFLSVKQTSPKSSSFSSSSSHAAGQNFTAVYSLISGLFSLLSSIASAIISTDF